MTSKDSIVSLELESQGTLSTPGGHKVSVLVVSVELKQGKQGAVSGAAITYALEVAFSALLTPCGYTPHEMLAFRSEGELPEAVRAKLSELTLRYYAHFGVQDKQGGFIIEQSKRSARQKFCGANVPPEGYAKDKRTPTPPSRL